MILLVFPPSSYSNYDTTTHNPYDILFSRGMGVPILPSFTPTLSVMAVGMGSYRSDNSAFGIKAKSDTVSVN